MVGIIKLDTYIYLMTIVVLCTSANVVVISNDTLEKIDVFYSLMSDFGGDNPKEGMQGYLVAADPIEACSTIKTPPDTNSSVHWIALIKRGNCTFSEKVYIAQNSKFDAVIVYNKLSDDIVTMHCEENCDLITIPSVFVGNGDGLKLLNRYLYDMAPGFIIWISTDLPFSFNSYFIPFVVIVIVCFLMMAGFMLVKCVRSRRQARRHRMPSSSLKKIPVIKYKKADPYDVCAICLEEYEEGDSLRILPCSHGYHTKCVDPWLTKNKRVCPCCKRKVFAENENQYESDSDSDFSNSENTPLLRGGNETRRQGGGTFDNGQETNVVIADERQPLVSSSSSDELNEDEMSVPTELASQGSHTSNAVRT